MVILLLFYQAILNKENIIEKTLGEGEKMIVCRECLIGFT